MGNLLKPNHEEDLVIELITLSNDTLTTEEVYDIMMKSSCNEYLDQAGELIGLFRRFVELDVNKKGNLNNHEFLSMAELKYNPFRPRLQVAIPMKSEDYIRSLAPAKDQSESFEKQTIDPNIIHSSSKVGQEPEDIKDVDLISYIDFSLFCQYLSVFSPRATSDTKVRCNNYIVLFRLFDIDGDDALSRADLEMSLKTLVAGNMNPDDIETVVKNIFIENGKEELKTLTRKDLQDSLLMTDFHQKLTLYFSA